MVKIKGKDRIIQVDLAFPPTGTFGNLLFLRQNSVSFDNTTVDVTNKDSPDGQEELDTEMGVQRITIQGSGIRSDSSAAQEIAFARAQDRKAHPFRYVDLTRGKRLEGSFVVENYQEDDPFDNSSTYSITLRPQGGVIEVNHP